MGLVRLLPTKPKQKGNGVVKLVTWGPGTRLPNAVMVRLLTTGLVNIVVSCWIL